MRVFAEFSPTNLLRLIAYFCNYSSGDLLKRLMAVRQVRSQISDATLRSLLIEIFALFNLIWMFVHNNKLVLIAIALEDENLAITLE